MFGLAWLQNEFEGRGGECPECDTLGNACARGQIVTLLYRWSKVVIPKKPTKKRKSRAWYNEPYHGHDGYFG